MPPTSPPPPTTTTTTTLQSSEQYEKVCMDIDTLRWRQDTLSDPADVSSPLKTTAIQADNSTVFYLTYGADGVSVESCTTQSGATGPTDMPFSMVRNHRHRHRRHRPPPPATATTAATTTAAASRTTPPLPPRCHHHHQMAIDDGATILGETDIDGCVHGVLVGTMYLV